MNLEAIIQTFKPDVKKSSIATYIHALKRVAPDKKIENLDFLKDTDAVIAKINELPLNTGRSTVSAILVSLLASGNKNDDVYQIYKLKSDELFKAMIALNSQNKKTPKEEENWVKHSVLLKIAESMIKNAPGSQRSLIAALYTYQPPTRLDYYDMEIIGKDAVLDDKKNYLRITNRSKKEFIFQDYKNVKSRGQVIIPVNKQINSVINKYMKLNPDIKYLLSNERKMSEPMSRNSLGKTIPKIFESTGKHITLNMIRHILASENINLEEEKKKKELADAMMHSSATQLNYAKH